MNQNLPSPWLESNSKQSIKVNISGKDLNLHKITNFKVNKTERVILKDQLGPVIGKIKVECIFTNKKLYEVPTSKPKIENFNSTTKTHNCGFSICFKTTTYNKVKAKLKISYILPSGNVKNFETDHYFTITGLETNFERKDDIESSLIKREREEYQDDLCKKKLMKYFEFIHQNPLSYSLISQD